MENEIIEFKSIQTMFIDDFGIPHTNVIMRNGTVYWAEGADLEMAEILEHILEDELDYGFSDFQPEYNINIDSVDEWKLRQTGAIVVPIPGEETLQFSDSSYVAQVNMIDKTVDCYLQDEHGGPGRFVALIISDFDELIGELFQILSRNANSGIEEAIFYAEEIGLEVIRDDEEAMEAMNEIWNARYGIDFV